jgi:hypothetical protein
VQALHPEEAHHLNQPKNLEEAHPVVEALVDHRLQLLPQHLLAMDIAETRYQHSQHFKSKAMPHARPLSQQLLEI